MNIKELFEGAAPKLPGAPSGVSIMTPDQFLAKSAEGKEPKPDEDVAEGFNEGTNDTVNSLTNLRATVKQILTGRAKYPQGFASQLEVVLYDAINALRDSPEQGARNTVNELSDLRAIAKQVQTGKGQFPQGYTGRLEWVLYDAIKQIENVPKGVAEGYQLDEGAVETITALVKKIPGIGKYYQMAQQYKPQLIEILKTSKSGKEVKQKMEQLAAGQSATVAESGMMKQLGGLAVGGGSILSTMWMNAMGMIDGVLAHAAAGEVGGAVASGSILGLIPVTLMLFAAMLLFKGSKQSSDEKAQAFQAQRGQQGVAEDQLNELDMFAPVTTFIKMTDGSYVQADWRRGQGNAGFSDSASFINFKPVNPTVAKQLGLDSHQRNNSISNHRDGTIASGGDYQGSGPMSSRRYEVVDYNKPETMEKLPDEIKPELIKWVQKQGVAEGEDQLNRIRKLSGLEEATKLSAPQRDFGDEEFQDYMKRTVGTPDLDKKTGQVKVDKKGKEKYVSGKLKTDKYKLPYIHRSSAIKYYSPEGKRYDPEQIKAVLKQRPKKLLKQNEKMKHSNGELEQFFNIGFAALVGIALDENTNNLIIVNTCPGAGSCKIDCFAMGGGKIQYEAPWQSDGKILTYLLNDPDGFFNQLSSEITKEESDGKKGGYKVSIRWHDAGDFFSPEYMDLAFKLADKFPNVDFYAYTKMAGAALGKKPDNFIINWSEGAHTSQEKQVKANDPNLDKTKNSRIVPDKLFQDLLVKNEKGNLIKGEAGQWQVVPEKLPELKQRLASEYGVSANSILSYDEWEQKTNRGKKEVPVKYNVIVAPGEPDLSANSHGVLGTFLLKH